MALIPMDLQLMPWSRLVTLSKSIHFLELQGLTLNRWDVNNFISEQLRSLQGNFEVAEETDSTCGG